MRGLLIFFAIVVLLFSLVYIESELVKLEMRKEHLKDRVVELQNQKEVLESKLMHLSNLARIEAEAKLQGFLYPKDEDILGVVR
jgi:cell division protein FtsL